MSRAEQSKSRRLEPSRARNSERCNWHGSNHTRAGGSSVTDRRGASRAARRGAEEGRSEGHLRQDGLREAGALEEGDGLLAADPAVAVQIRGAEVGVEGRLHRPRRRAGAGGEGGCRRRRGAPAGEIGGSGRGSACGRWWVYGLAWTRR